MPLSVGASCRLVLHRTPATGGSPQGVAELFRRCSNSQCPPVNDRPDVVWLGGGGAEGVNKAQIIAGSGW